MLDDLHWADQASLLLLQFMARDRGAARLLLVGTYRDVELGRQHPLEQALGELARLPHCDRVLLRGLKRDDIHRFLELSAGRTPPAGLVDAVERETEGNPFFVHEVVRLLQAEGRLDRLEDVASWSVEIPQGVRQVIGRRLSALSEACNALLASAAVIGRDFDLDILSRVSELAMDEVLELVEQAESARILVEVKGQPGTRRFSHALVRETLYDELRTTRRVRLHRRVGEVLESRDESDVEARLAQLAHHFCEAAPGGDVEKAVAYAERAAQRSLRLLAFEDAANHYERALSALEARDGSDPARRCELQVLQGEALVAAGEAARARPLLREALRLARELGEQRLFGRAVLGMGCGTAYSSASRADPELLARLEEAAERTRSVDEALRSRLLSRLGSELFFADSPQRRAAVISDAVDTARRSGDPEALAAALWQEVYVSERNDLDQRLVLTGEIVDLARRAGDLRGEFLGREAQFGLLVQKGEGPAVDNEIAHLEAIAAELRRPAQQARVEAIKAGRALWAGELVEARDRSWTALQISQRVDLEGARQTYGVQYYQRRRMEGRLVEVIEAVEEGTRRFPTAVIWRCLLVAALAEGGRATEVGGLLASLIADDMLRPERDPFLLEDLTLAADACLVVRDTEAASDLYHRLLPGAGRFACSTSLLCMGAMARSVGNMAGVLGLADEAIEHLETAVEAERRFGALGWLPRSQVDLARALLDRGDPADHDRAIELLAEASRTAKRLGLTGWAAMALKLRLRARGADSDSAQTLEI